MILEMARGHIRYRHVSGQVVTIGVETLLSGYGSSDVVIQANSIDYWDSPLDDVHLTKVERDSVLTALSTELAGCGISYVVD